MTQTEELAGESTLIGGDETDASQSSTTRMASPVLRRGATVGRYVVLDRLGAGGMGVVYRAIDPQLERMVALKLLRFGEGDDREGLRTRLLREAQAMARVRHPNAVTVYDVGIEDGRVHVAMELVEGQTLSAWLRAEPRSWSRVLEVLLEAGRGLAAAHAQHLVHRDFKPDNVMVTEQGRVVVMDFGLARGHDMPAEEVTGRSEASSGALLLSSEITRAGALIGTPAYMSPEQLAGKEADARSDQFAFCVALFEGLYGQRPFQADGVMALVLAITKGRIVEIPAGVRGPGWLYRAVLRGLAGRPEDRWPSMDALLQALEDPPQRRRRRRLVRGAVALGVGGVLALAVTRSEPPDDRCTGAATRLEGVWDADRRRQAGQTLAALELPWATTVVEAAVTELDQYAAQWIDMHTEACRATVMDGSQSQEAMDLRVSCLERARMDLGAVAEQLVQLDVQVVGKAHELTQDLPLLDTCADLEVLRAQVPPPSDPKDRQTLERLQEHLARARSTARAGKYAEVTEQLAQLEPEIDALGYRPLRARFLVARGNNQVSLGRYPEAREDLEQGLELGLELQLQATSSIARSLALVASLNQQRPDEGLIYARLAVGLARRRGADPTEPSYALVALGTAQMEAGEPAAALEILHEALALDPGDDPLLTRSIHNKLGSVLQDLGRFEDALLESQRSLELSLETLGPDHPDQVTAHSNLAHMHQRLGNYDQAEAGYRRALALARASFDDQHPNIAMTRFNLGTLLVVRERLEDAEPYIRGALEIVEATMGPTHPRAGAIHGNLAGLLIELGREREAGEHARKGLEITVEALGPEHPKTANARALLALSLEAQDRLDEAEPLLEETLEHRRASFGSQHPIVLRTLQILGRVRLAGGRLKEARPPLEEAIEGYHARPRSPVEDGNHAEALFLLARVRWQLDDDRPGAIGLVEDALELMPSEDARRDSLEEWLADRRPKARG